MTGAEPVHLPSVCLSILLNVILEKLLFWKVAPRI